jgi:glycosyltransferase involved in cell wall biosynthesis
VRPKSGWFSDRSVCYLAAGRPVITQETGFSKFIETGKGLFPFASVDEITEALFKIEEDYQRHVMGARDIAQAFFGAEDLLAKMVETCGI